VALRAVTVEPVYKHVRGAARGSSQEGAVRRLMAGKSAQIASFPGWLLEGEYPSGDRKTPYIVNAAQQWEAQPQAYAPASAFISTMIISPRIAAKPPYARMADLFSIPEDVPSSTMVSNYTLRSINPYGIVTDERIHYKNEKNAETADRITQICWDASRVYRG